MADKIEKNNYNWNGSPLIHEPRSESQYSKPVSIDLFCGPGGISHGLRNAGFEPVLGVDIHEPSIDTYMENHEDAYTVLGNVKKINGDCDVESILDIIEIDDYGQNSVLRKLIDRIGVNNLDLLTGGIPCQGFSIANKKRDDEDERNYLFEEFIRCVKITDPEYVLIENVSTMQSAKDGEFVEDIEKCLRKLDYTVDHKVLKATEFGVPQSRERLFFLASKNQDDILWPNTSVAKNDFVTVNEAISDLPSLNAGESTNSYQQDPENAYQRQMRDKKHGLSNHKAPNHRKKTVERIRNTVQGEPMYDRFRQRVRLDPNEPSPTIIAGGIRPQFQFGHPVEDRGLTVRERARIQSFPDDYVFEGGLTQSRVQTGMAVPPMLAEKLGEKILEMLDE